MGVAVFIEFQSGQEGFVTHRTLIRLLFQVAFCMVICSSFVGEKLSTDGTFNWMNFGNMFLVSQIVCKHSVTGTTFPL
jgi:uncharacterized membrane protein (DUF485 family)